uniref:proline-rich protein 2-like n=1 Tax=Nyctereutes procyonoides TaxID=34880 RepID=UPI002444D03D|nr:proline-rich protein 2-like [Nyctereutes procyonoides]
MQGAARAAAPRSQRPQPLRRPGGRQRGSSAIQGRPGRLDPGGAGPQRTLPGPRNVPGGAHAPPAAPARPRRSAPRPGGDPPRPPPRPPTPGLAGGSPGSRSPALAAPAGTPPRLSASRAGPRGDVASRAPQSLEPPPRPRRPSAHGCSRRVALLAALRAPPPEQPRAHWPAAPRPRSLARSTPALIGPRRQGAEPHRPAPREAPPRSQIRLALRIPPTEQREGKGAQRSSNLDVSPKANRKPELPPQSPIPSHPIPGLGYAVTPLRDSVYLTQRRRGERGGGGEVTSENLGLSRSGDFP